MDDQAKPLNASVSAKVEAATHRWGLTPREAEVLAVVAKGETNKAIAAQLGCSVRTVEAHLGRLMRKAKVDGRTELVVRLFEGL
jgi:DNA-binding NarL/FixJ family response regulator